MHRVLSRCLVIALFFLALMAPVVHLFKVTRVNYDLGAYFFYFGFPATCIFVWVVLLISPQRKSLPFGFVFFFFLSLYGVALYFLYGGYLFDFFGNLLRFLFCSGMIYLLYLNGGVIVGFLERNVALYSRMAASVSIICAGILHAVSFLGGSVYFGLQNTIAFVSLSYGLVYKRFLIMGISSLSIILSGKRGVMLAALCLIFYFLCVKFFLYKSRYAFFVSILGILGVFLYSMFGEVPTSIAHRFSEFSDSGSVDWNAATAGRMDEVVSVLSVVKNNYNVGLWGMGHGATININGAVDSTVHLSPLGMTMIVGGLFTAVVYLYFFVFVFKGVFIFSESARYKIYQVWFLVFVGEFVFSFTAFTLLQSYMLWLSFGVVVYFFSFKIKSEGIIERRS